MGNSTGFWGTPNFFRNTPNWTNIPTRWGWVNTYGTWSLRAWGCIGLCFTAFIQCCFPILCLILEIMVDHHLRDARLKTQLKGSNRIKLISSNLYHQTYIIKLISSLIQTPYFNIILYSSLCFQQLNYGSVTMPWLDRMPRILFDSSWRWIPKNSQSLRSLGNSPGHRFAHCRR